jgi:hypothetical protein
VLPTLCHACTIRNDRAAEVAGSEDLYLIPILRSGTRQRNNFLLFHDFFGAGLARIVR